MDTIQYNTRETARILQRLLCREFPSVEFTIEPMRFKEREQSPWTLIFVFWPSCRHDREIAAIAGNFCHGSFIHDEYVARCSRRHYVSDGLLHTVRVSHDHGPIVGFQEIVFLNDVVRSAPWKTSSEDVADLCVEDLSPIPMTKLRRAANRMQTTELPKARRCQRVAVERPGKEKDMHSNETARQETRISDILAREVEVARRALVSLAETAAADVEAFRIRMVAEVASTMATEQRQAETAIRAMAAHSQRWEEQSRADAEALVTRMRRMSEPAPTGGHDPTKGSNSIAACEFESMMMRLYR